LELFDGLAQQNAVVVTRMLRERVIDASERVVQKLVAPRRRELRAAQLATVRFETEPGQQMQVDFGQKRVRIGACEVIVHFLVAVLSYCRRIFVKPFLAERADDWREGIAEAFRHFGGVPRTVLGDNARALVLEHNRKAQTVTFHPAYRRPDASAVKFVKRGGAHSANQAPDFVTGHCWRVVDDPGSRAQNRTLINTALTAT
jgi:transposase